jgi:chemotaxis response regulator CheB
MTENNASKGQESQKEAEKDTEGKVSLPAEPAEPLAVVGIGSSAGGLEALEIFFNHMHSAPGPRADQPPSRDTTEIH